MTQPLCTYCGKGIAKRTVSVWLKLSSDTAPDWDRGFSRGVCVEADADNYRLVFWFDN